jgi:hypothetical protein
MITHETNRQGGGHWFEPSIAHRRPSDDPVCCRDEPMGWERPDLGAVEGFRDPHLALRPEPQASHFWQATGAPAAPRHLREAAGRCTVARWGRATA